MQDETNETVTYRLTIRELCYACNDRGSLRFCKLRELALKMRNGQKSCKESFLYKDESRLTTIGGLSGCWCCGTDQGDKVDGNAVLSPISIVQVVEVTADTLVKDGTTSKCKGAI